MAAKVALSSKVDTEVVRALNAVVVQLTALESALAALTARVQALEAKP